MQGRSGGGAGEGALAQRGGMLFGGSKFRRATNGKPVGAVVAEARTVTTTDGGGGMNGSARSFGADEW